MQQQFALAEGITIEDIAKSYMDVYDSRIISKAGTYVHTDNERLAVFDFDVGVLDVDLAQTNALDFCSDKSHSAFIGIFNEVFMPSLAVFGKLFFSAFYGHIAA